jgi:hypothetical protein
LHVSGIRVKQGRGNTSPYQAELKKRREDKHIGNDYKLNCRQPVCKKFTKKGKEKKKKEFLSQAYVGLPSPCLRQEKWHWNLSIASPVRKCIAILKILRLPHIINIRFCLFVLLGVSGR